MKKIYVFLGVLMAVFCLNTYSYSQCTNASPFGTFTAPTNNTPTAMSTCIFGGEYNTINSCVSGSQYTFSATGGIGNYLTVHQGTPGGAVLGQGFSPLTVTCTASGPLYLHVNTTMACGTDGSCHSTFITCNSCVGAPDPCTTITTMACGVPQTATLSGSGLWSPGSCGFTTPGTEKIYSFTPAVTGTYSLNVSSTNSAAFIDYFWKAASGGCNSSGWNCIDDIFSPITSPIGTLTAGTQYYILLDPESTTNVIHTFQINCLAVDPCLSITSLTCGTPVTASTTGAGAWSPGSCGFTTPGQEKVYSFTPAISGTYTLQITAASGGFGDYYYKLASGGCSSTGWTCIGDASSPESNNFGPLTAGTTYYILYDSEVTGAASQTFQINCLCNFVPTITLTESSGTANNGIICPGASANLTANGGGTYLWSTGATSAAITVTPASTTTYTVTVTAPDLCVSTATATVTVSALPTATSGATPNPICVGQTLNLTSSGGTSYSWSGPGGYTSALQNPTRPNVTLAMAGVYTVTVTNANGCTATSSKTVVVNALPTATATASPNPVCSGSTLILSATGGVSYAWSGPGGFSATGANTQRYNIQPSQAGVYTVTVTNAGGCSSTASVTVAVNQTPNGTVTATPSTVCVGNSLQLGATGGGTYSWSGPFGFTSNLQNPSIPITTYQQAGLYYVTITGAGGCSSTYKVEIKVIYPPIAVANHTQSSACTGATLQLLGSGAGAYSWTGPGGFTSTLQNPVRPNATAAYSGVYTLVVTSPNGCTATATTTVSIVAPPVVSASVEDNSVCEGSSVFLHSSGASSYTWAGPYGYTSAYQHPVINNIPIYLSGNYVVTGKGPTGCTATASVLVNVYPGINGTASATPNPAFLGQNVQFSASGGTNYLWTGPNGFGSTDQNPLLYNAGEKAAGIYTVIISNAGGCQYTLHVTLTFVDPKPGVKEGYFDVTSTKPIQGYIYPNPANNTINLDRTENSAILYSIMDANGKVVIKNQVSSDGQIRVETLTPGIYNIIWSEQKELGATYFGKFVRVE